MGYIESRVPVPNADKEYIMDITPCTDGKITLYDITRHFPPYDCRQRRNMFSRVTHVIGGKTASVYIIDDYKILERAQAIVLATRYLKGDYLTYRLD